MVIHQNKFKYLIILCILTSGLCYSQQKRYNFTFKDARLEIVIKELSNQSKINILYNPGILPGTIKINGSFKNLTLNNALDTFLHHAQILYKFYKGDIVLYKSNENVKETHQIFKTSVQKNNGNDKTHETITDTVIYTIITHDTVVTKLTDYVKVQLNDTVRVYDTTKVIQKVLKTVDYYKPKKLSLIAELAFSKGAVLSNFKMADSKKDFSNLIHSSIKAKSGSSLGVNFIYRNKNMMVEGGVAFSKYQYSFSYNKLTDGFITVTDTIDKYFTTIVQGDTTWVYVTKDRQLERQSERKYLSDLSYQYISVPILVGYTMVVKNFTLEFKGGILFNFYIQSKGLYVNISDSSVISVESSKAPGSVILLGAYGALGIDYYLNKKVHIFAQPFINWNALPIGKKNAIYTSTQLQTGIEAGIRYYF